MTNNRPLKRNAASNPRGTIIDCVHAHRVLTCLLERMSVVEGALEKLPGWSREQAEILEEQRDVYRDKLTEIESALVDTPCSSLKDLAGKAEILLRLADSSATDQESRLLRSLCHDLILMESALLPNGHA